jgi:type I restriction enzyme S subunit
MTRQSITEAGLRSSSSHIITAGHVVVAVKIVPGAMRVVERGIAINQDLRGLLLKDEIDPYFLTYYFKTIRVVGNGTIVKGITNSTLESIRIPVPPLEVQREIVRVLDHFTQLEAELQAELEARRRQHEHYRRQLLSFVDGAARWMTLGDIGRVAMCKRIFKSETTSSGGIPFYKIGTFGGRPDAFIAQEIYEDYRSRYSFPSPGDVLISAAGTIGRTIQYDGKPAYFQDSNIVWIDNDESIVSNAYLKHWYQVIAWSTDGGTIRRLYNDNIRRARIAVPSRDEQDRIVRILDGFDALINDRNIGIPAELAARRKQYEYFCAKLLTFEEAAA